MSKIKVMSTALSNRIAAGEVIERPASVVKELVENAIDAGSSFITVEVERAGSRLIAVTDDGCGMDQEDAALSLEQHGTSKLLSEDDLEHIMTLGFRGEALPSIASVSRFTMITRTADAPEGTMNAISMFISSRKRNACVPETEILSLLSIPPTRFTRVCFLLRSSMAMLGPVVVMVSLSSGRRAAILSMVVPESRNSFSPSALTVISFSSHITIMVMYCV